MLLDWSRQLILQCSAADRDSLHFGGRASGCGVGCLDRAVISSVGSAWLDCLWSASTQKKSFRKVFLSLCACIEFEQTPGWGAMHEVLWISVIHNSHRWSGNPDSLINKHRLNLYSTCLLQYILSFQLASRAIMEVKQGNEVNSSPFQIVHSGKASPRKSHWIWHLGRQKKCVTQVSGRSHGNGKGREGGMVWQVLQRKKSHAAGIHTQRERQGKGVGEPHGDQNYKTSDAMADRWWRVSDCLYPPHLQTHCSAS